MALTTKRLLFPVLASLLACSGSEPLGEDNDARLVLPDFKILKVSGDSQSAEVNRVMPDSLIVQVLVDGEPLVDSRVAWEPLRPLDYAERSAGWCGYAMSIGPTYATSTDAFGLTGIRWGTNTQQSYPANILPLRCQMQGRITQSFMGVQDTALVLFYGVWTERN